MAGVQVRDLTDFGGGPSGTIARNVVLLDASGNPIAFSPANPGVVTANLPADATASGTLGASNAAVTMSVAGGIHGVAYELDAGLSASTVLLEATLDDANWFTINSVTEAGIVRS